MEYDIMAFSVLAIFKNETVNLKEWIDHYFWQGAKHIYLCDNDSNDDPISILQPYIDEGRITYWVDTRHPSQFNYTRHIQNEIYIEFLNALKMETNSTEWLLITDLDEFWYTNTGTLHHELSNIDSSIKCILVYWKIFGPSQSGNHPTSLRKDLIYRKPDVTSSKYMFRIQTIDPSALRIHGIDGLSSTEIYIPSNIHINHYVIQSYWYFTNIKIPRGNIAGDFTIYTHEYIQKHYDGHTVMDTMLADQVKAYETNLN